VAAPEKDTASQPARVQPLSGRVADRFVIRDCLGEGGMGEVYRADDTRLQRPVALKRLTAELRADDRYREHLLKEAHRAAALDTQHIAGVYDVLEEGGELFLVMEYVEGATLRRHLPATYSVPDFLEIAIQCGEALEAAHDKGVVHRDIKPENIMLTPGGQVKILDFGLAKQLPAAGPSAETQSFVTGAREFSGTWGYMAPEVLLQKSSDGRADLFSLGVVFYEMLTGRNPFLAVSYAETVDRTLHEIPVPLTQLKAAAPLALEHVLEKLLAKDANERYASAHDLVTDLKLLHRQIISGERLALPARPAGRPRLSSALIAMLGVVTVALAGLLLWRLLPGQPAPSAPAQPGAAGQPKLLAVLPFRTIGGSAESQYYGEGLSATLSAKLTQLTATHELQVVPAGEVHARKVTDVDQARQLLGANLVLEGSLHQIGDTVRVDYELVDADSKQNLRADAITVKAADPFAREDRVVDSLVATLGLSLNPQERQALAAYGTRVARAYDLYLQGRGYLQNYDNPANVESAVGLFQRALSLDPNYALAYAGLGEAYWRRYVDSKDTQWVASARQACEKAVGLDAKLSAAHACLGTVDNGTGRYQEGVAEFQKALESEPTSDAAYRGLAVSYQKLNQPAEAERTFQRAIQLRPNYWAGHSWLAAFYAQQARYADSAEQFKKASQLAPSNSLVLSSLGGIYLFLGRYDDAITALRRSVQILPSASAYSNLGYAYFRQRRFGEAVPVFEQAFKLAPNDYRMAGNVADAYYWAGQKTQAEVSYKRAIQLAQEAAKVNPKDSTSRLLLAKDNAMLGRRTEALKQLDLAFKATPNDPEALFYAALVYNQLGDREAALNWLQKAVAHGYSPAEIKNAVELDNLRQDPKFQALVRPQ
jgi:eukaryotic-like serine/threonine-protein kinase